MILVDWTVCFKITMNLRIFGGVNWQVPNGFGCALGAMQLILYAIYRNNKGEPQKKVNSDGSMEMMGDTEKAADRDPAKHQLNLINKQVDEQV